MDKSEVLKTVVSGLWTDSELWDYIVKIYGFGPRFGGTRGEEEATRYVEEVFKHIGLMNVRREPFEYMGWSRGTAKLEIIEPVYRELKTAISLVQSPSTDDDGLVSEVVFVGDGTPDEFNEVRELIKDRIVLVTSRSPIKRPTHRREKYGLAVEYGAKGFIFMNSQPGYLPQTGSLRTNSIGEIPAVAVSYEDGLEIIRLLERGSVKVRMYVKNEYGVRTSWHVYGEIPGKSKDELIIVGAHLDSHDICPGAIDNACGAATVLELAKLLAPFKGVFERTIKFICFTLEEMGLTGSTIYVSTHSDEVSRTRLMINLDGIGAHCRKTFTANGFDDLKEFVEEILSRYCYNIEVYNEINIASDHFPFLTRGVPVLSLSCRERRLDRGYTHTYADTLDKVDLAYVREAATLAALVIIEAAFADRLPRRRDVKEVIELFRNKGIDEILKRTKQWNLYFRNTT